MDIIFSDTKSGEKTIKINDILIHSSYNPNSEALKYVTSLDFNIIPKIIFVIEPGLSYLYSHLKNKYPNSKVGVIRFTNKLEQYNKDWDFSFNYFDSNIDNFEEDVSKNFSESDLCSSVFVNWNPTQKVFNDLNHSLWGKIKNIIENARTILITRQYFEKKWLINTCNSLKYGNFHFIDKINPQNKDVLIVASGPSLKKAIKTIKENSNNLFIICLSSAIPVLKFYNITPDLYISTDGGYWAGEHLKLLLKQKDVPIILPLESYCKKSILQNNYVIPGNYEDGISNEIAKISGIKCLSLTRNGTISGTALEFAKTITTNNIFFAGLDLQGTIGFQHILPNEIEKNNSIKTNKIKTTETLQSASRYNSKSLLIYRQWFSNYKKTEKTFRIIEDKNNCQLGTIKDITTEEFSSLINKSSTKEKQTFSKIELKIDKQKLLNYINENIKTNKWQTTLFALDYVALNNSKTDEQKNYLNDKIKERTSSVLHKIKEILDD